jgi:ectoine hydroxylase-related dioxygenase (phytanoyl-CoA dioxygenase family)
LSDAQLKHFEREGYLVIDPQIPEEALDQVRTDLEEKFDPAPPWDNEYPRVGRIQDAWVTTPSVRTLVNAPRVLAVLRELYGREPLPFQTLNFPVGTEQPVHSDTIHFNSMPSGWMCGVWIALEDIDEDNGPLVYYPGSQNLPEYTLADVGVPVIRDSYEHYHHYEKLIIEVIKSRGLKAHYATIKKGQAFIWAANLLHGGSPRRDRKRSRQSQVSHYFFSGCKYYTPLFSDEDQVYWRNPVRIQPE